jgi:hypothetical protein
MFIIKSLHRISGRAREFLDAYAIPLDGTPTYANIPDAVRVYLPNHHRLLICSTTRSI